MLRSTPRLAGTADSATLARLAIFATFFILRKIKQSETVYNDGIELIPLMACQG
jgi:hypothetical protein